MHEHDYAMTEDERPTFEEMDELREEIASLKAEIASLYETIESLQSKITQARQIIGFGDSRDDPEHGQ